MGKTFGSGDSTTQKKASSSTDSTKLPLAGGTLTGDVTMDTATPTLTLGNGTDHNTDKQIQFLSSTRDYHITHDDDERTLLIGEWNGSDPTVDVGIKVSENGALNLNKTITVGTGAEEDTEIVFDGNAQDYYIGLDDSADALLLGLGSTVGTTPVLVLTRTSLVDNGPGLHYLPATIVDTGDSGTTITTSQSAVTVVLTNAAGFVTLPSSAQLGFQVVVCNASASNNSGAIRRAGSNQFYNPDATSGQVDNQAISAMKAKTCIYYATNKWLVIG
tara:strand:+ start:189 stop:1010 length:822 start_codon:yes stop_codon:yes gene_type:complete